MEPAHLAAFARVLARTQTPEVSLWDAEAYSRAIGWGAYFEKRVAQLRPPKNGLGTGAVEAQDDALGDDDWCRAGNILCHRVRTGLELGS